MELSLWLYIWLHSIYHSGTYARYGISIKYGISCRYEGANLMCIYTEIHTIIYQITRIWKPYSHCFPTNQGTDDLKDLNKLKRAVYDVMIYLEAENTNFQGNNFVSQVNGTYFIS